MATWYEWCCPNIQWCSCPGEGRAKRSRCWRGTSQALPSTASKNPARKTSTTSSLHRPLCTSPTFREASFHVSEAQIHRFFFHVLKALCVFHPRLAALPSARKTWRICSLPEDSRWKPSSFSSESLFDVSLLLWWIWGSFQCSHHC